MIRLTCREIVLHQGGNPPFAPPHHMVTEEKKKMASHSLYPAQFYLTNQFGGSSSILSCLPLPHASFSFAFKLP